ncbi:phage terminase large subunit family protein [Halopseudomonas oceani]|uniref:phage terminase large subunit family protein n=1 Tax=Halopseudomonas oceani TaxID=1708783 RepID=UPI002AA645E2|nr:phage terminase large subunit family protein [Halopseudomonas oceani]
MNIDYADGAEQYRSALCRGLEPDPELWIDEWADEYMRIPRDTGAAEPGPYRTDRTPYAREPMRCLSPAHPAKRVVTKVASQMMKTQIALNWIGGVIHMAPSNILTLLPSLGLAKRVSGRIDKTVKASPALREKVAVSRSRDSRNTMDTKEFEGGTLYVTTAGSAANLAEVSARYVYGDEVDRWDVDVQNEGDPVELAEARGSTFGRNAKFYFSSSPTVKGASRITDLFEQGDQRHYYVPCPYCGEYQHLEWQNLKWAKDYSWAGMVCCNEHCSGQGAFIEEHHKAEMLAKGEWRAHSSGDGETVSFTLSALYMPLGWKSWVDLARQYDKAAAALAKGDLEPMQVFYNTRLAEVWDSAQEMTKAEELQKRAEDYRLGTVPALAMLLTAAVDTQDDRLEMLVIGWGEGLERWVVDHKVIQGRPEDDRTWAQLDEELKRRYLHASGIELSIRAAPIDSGGHHTQEVYQFCRLRRWRNIFAVKGASKTGRPVIAQRPSKVDVTWKGTTEKEGAELWLIGTDTAKDWIYNRYGLKEGPGALHFSNDLPDDFYAQCVAERKITRYVRGYRRVEWTKAKADRNEGLDLLVYNLAMAHYLSIPRYSVADWERLRTAFSQRSLFSEPADITAPAPADDDPQESSEVPSKPEPKPPAPAPAAARRRTSRSGYLSRR